MTAKLNLFDIDQQFAIHAIETGNCQAWRCPTVIFDPADKIEAMD